MSSKEVFALPIQPSADLVIVRRAKATYLCAKPTPVLNKSCSSATYRGWETNRGSLVSVEDELTNAPSRQGY